MALQPCGGVHKSGSIRRVANILLALNYPSQGDAIVNENSYRLLKEYAPKGQLYTQALREHLLAISYITKRVCIMALTTTARKR